MPLLPITPRVAGERNNSEVFHRSFMEETRGALATRPIKNYCCIIIRLYAMGMPLLRSMKLYNPAEKLPEISK